MGHVKLLAENFLGNGAEVRPAPIRGYNPSRLINLGGGTLG